MSNCADRRNLSQIILVVLGAAVVAACGVATSVPTVGSTTQIIGATDTPVPTTSPEPLLPTASTATPSPTSIPIAGDISSRAFKLPLTIQHVTDTSAELYFELSEPLDGLVIYQAIQDNSFEQIVPFDASAAAHQISLGGLSPGTEYRVAVVLNEADGQYRKPGYLNEDWGEISFRTWSDRQPLRFGIIGDPGFADSVTPRLAEQMAASELDFGIVIGDIVYKVFENSDPFEAFALKYYQPFSSVLHQMPMYPVVGNHDEQLTTIWDGMPFYYHAFPAFADPRFQPSTANGRNQWYAFAYGPVQFIVLNTQAFYDQTERAEQNAWLAERLADGRFSTSIPVFHIAPYTEGLHVADGLPVRSDWQPLFEQAGVRLVLSGHDHNYQRLLVNGITYIVSGGGSATLYEKTQALQESQVFARKSHFVVFEVYPDRIDLKSIALGGEVIDQTSIPLQ